MSQNQPATAAAITVGAISGNSNLSAGQTYTQTGSDVLAPGGDIHISAQTVTINEARETSQKGIEQRARQSGRMQALAADNVAFNARQAAHAVQAGGMGISGTTYTQVGGHTVHIDSGSDTTLQGAVVQGEQVTATVGGNLTIETLQDQSQYRERSRSARASVTIGPASGGSLNLGQTRITSDYQSTTEQSGIRAGDGGFQVNVAGHTTLTGGAIISSADIVITDVARHQALTNEAPEQTAERLQVNAQGSMHTGVDVADVQAMRRQVEADRAIQTETARQFSILGDQVYRKETEDKTIHILQCETNNKERCGLSAVVSLDQVRAVNGVITAFNNGMLSTEEQALMTAYMQASGMQLQDGILVIVNPRLNSVVAEGTWVIYKKMQEVFGFGSSSVGELNLALEAIAASQGARLNSIAHSAGNFGVAEMNRRLQKAGRTDAAIGTQTMFGSPVNAQSQADRVNNMTGGQGVVQQSTHQNDFVGTLFGNNPSTGGNAQTGALPSHSAYTGDLTTSTSEVPQVQSGHARSPADIKEITDQAWGPERFSAPIIVRPNGN